MTLSAQPSPRGATLLEKMRSSRPRVIFALDATASREATWDLASQLQSKMFEEAAGLEVQLLYYRGPDEVRTNGNPSVDPDPQDTRVCHQRQVGTVQSGLQKGTPWADPYAAVDVQRYGADTRRQRLVRRRAVEICDPRVPHFGSSAHERGCATVEFRHPADEDRTFRSVQRSGKVKVILDCPEMGKHVAP